ncbi:microtubule-associated protein futsch [Hetaerina americana]|uniref:microtubule-associated protein futsch n=1 Tax=Hetaerina americana TaxID=62018 RepID=UPI003A7F4F87
MAGLLGEIWCHLFCSGCRTSGEIFQDSLRHSVSHDSVFSSGERRVSSGGGGSGASSGRPPQPLAPSSSAQQVAAHQSVRPLCGSSGPPGSKNRTVLGRGDIASSRENLNDIDAALGLEERLAEGSSSLGGDLLAELFDAVRRRRWRGHSQDREDNGDEVRGAAASAGRSSDEEEDLGLPRSPCNSPSSGEAGLRSDQKEIQSKSHSTCSEGSLLSMGSSDMDEDSQGHFSGHSSKLSLQEKSSSQYDLELDLGATAEPLSHSAARHKMAVRPKRTHGAPRLRRLKEVTSLGSLPTTPEVNEDSGRCSSPETSFNQETSSNEQIQVPSDIPLHKNTSITSPAAEIPSIPSRMSHTHHQSSSSKVDSSSPLHLPESISPPPRTLNQFISDGSRPADAKPSEFCNEDASDQKNENTGSPTKNISDSKRWGDESMSGGEAGGSSIDDATGMDETESGGTNLLSRILSWRGSKKKVDEPPEGATAALEGPSRRMDVHGRYVHEVICETEDFASQANQTPPSPGWRPTSFSTSWPPLVHSTPRSCHTSSRQISSENIEQGKDDSEEAMWASVEFSGPHSLPLMLQEDMMDSRHVRDGTEKGQNAFTHGPEPFSVKSKAKPFVSHSEAQVEVTLAKSSSMKAHRLDHQHGMFYSSDAPESLPVSFERSELDSSSALPPESFLRDDARNDGMAERDVPPPRDALLKSSAEGLLTLDVNRTVEETSPTDVLVGERCGYLGANEEASGANVDGWDEGQRRIEEELDLGLCTPVHDLNQTVGGFESMVMLQHTNMEQSNENFQQQSFRRADDSHKVDKVPEAALQDVTGSVPTPVDQLTSMALLAGPRYKRNQSVPSDLSVSKSSEVPEFLRVQLNHVDSRPTTNVVLLATGGVPMPVNTPESSDTPVRRRMRPHSADGLETNQSESLGPLAMGRAVISDSTSHDKLASTTRGRPFTREFAEVTQLGEIGRAKEASQPQNVQSKQVDLMTNKVESFEEPPVKEENGSSQIRKSPTREIPFMISNENNSTPVKDPPLVGRMIRKSTEDLSKGSGNVVMPIKENEDVKQRPMSVRESLGVVMTQNDINRPKDASLPPKAVRKVSGDDAQVEVVPRRKSTTSKDFGTKSKEDEPELFKVFARRSLKLKDSESWENHPPPQQQQRSRDSDKENDSGDNAIDVVILPMSKEQKQRDSLIRGEFLKDSEHPVKSAPTHSADTPHHLRPLQRIPSSNGIIPPNPLNTGNVELRNNSLYGNSEKPGGEGPKLHRSSVTGGSLPRREGPSPEKRPRGSSINLPPESQPIRVEMNRVGIPSELRRPSWASQMHSEGISDAFGKSGASEISEVCRQPIDLGMDGEEDSKPHFKRIQQRKEEWELRARMQ